MFGKPHEGHVIYLVFEDQRRVDVLPCDVAALDPWLHSWREIAMDGVHDVAIR